MSSRLIIAFCGFCIPVAAQFVNVVRNNQAQAAYVNGYSKRSSDQVVQYTFKNTVIPPGGTAPAYVPLQPYKTSPSQVQFAAADPGLPQRAREALETAASTEDSDVVSTTDAFGVTKFTTTVTDRRKELIWEQHSEGRRTEVLKTPLNRSLLTSLMYVAALGPGHEHHSESRIGRK